MAVGIEPIKGVDGTGANGTPGTKGSVLFDRPVRSDCDSLARRVARRVRPNFDGSLSSKQTFERQVVERYSSNKPLSWLTQIATSRGWLEAMRAAASRW